MEQRLAYNVDIDSRTRNRAISRLYARAWVLIEDGTFVASFAEFTFHLTNMVPSAGVYETELAWIRRWQPLKLRITIDVEIALILRQNLTRSYNPPDFHVCRYTGPSDN